MKQKSFADLTPEFKQYWKHETRVHHGGTYSMGKRKTRRPLSGKKPVHLVMRSDIARGAMSLRLPKNRQHITGLIQKYAKRFDIRIYKYSINSNHLHFLLRSKTRKSFQDFLRTIAGLIARFMLSAERGNKKGKFWSVLAFTRISEWGRAFQALRGYVIQNILEAAGVIAYTPRKNRARRIV